MEIKWLTGTVELIPGHRREGNAIVFGATTNGVWAEHIRITFENEVDAIQAERNASGLENADSTRKELP